MAKTKGGLLFVGLCVFTAGFSQNIGIGTTNPDPSAVLDIASADKGLLIPRLSLSSQTNPSPVSSPAVGLLIFNDGKGGVQPAGFYWWDGAKWSLLLDSVATAGPIVGYGTSSSPITLQAGNNAGEVLIWDGSQWTTGVLTTDSVCNTAVANYVQKWTGSKLCNSVIYDDGTNVGIGISTPTATLDINGTLRVRTINAVTSATANDRLLVANNNGEVFGIQFTGSNSDYLRGDGTWGAISGGDNWGTQVAITSAPIIGDGTTANPITLQSGTNAGDILVWTGTQWAIQQPSPTNGVAPICATPGANYVQKWTGSQLCNSLIYDNGTNVAIGTSVPNSDAILELYSTNKGFLPPRVALVDASLPNPLSSPAAGMLVYNTATSGTGQNAVVPGYYYWDGTRWQRLQNSGYAGAVLGNRAATNYILDAVSPQGECTGASITLPPGKWIVNLVEIIRIAQDSSQGPSPCHVWVRTTLSDVACTQGTKTTSLIGVATADLIVGSLISGGIGNNWEYSLVNGSVIINNTSGANKTYYVWANIQTTCALGTDGISTNDGLVDFLGPSWGETQFYALPVN